MKKVYVLMANGTEECEALIVVDLLRRAKIDVKTVSIYENSEIISSHNVQIGTDLIYNQTDFSDGDMLVLPGGQPGTDNLAESDEVSQLIDSYKAADKWLAAICAAPSILGKKGLLDGLSATAFPSFSEQLGAANYTGESVEVSANEKIVTGKALGAAIPFALTLIEQLLSANEAEAVRKQIYYPYGY